MAFNKLSLLFSFIFLLNCGETKQEASTEFKTVSSMELELNQNKGLVYHTGLLFSGISEKRYANGNLSEVITYQNGKKHGAKKLWFESGVLSYSANYNEGKLTGEVHSFWSNGNKKSLSNYKNGILHGTQTQWYSSGVIFKELNIENGIEVGIQRAWRENGTLYNNYEMRDGKIYGLKRASLCFELEDEEVIID